MRELLRFDGRTALVTGAGGNPGLGRAHAMLLAARGANVVVNDIGQDPLNKGYQSAASAEAVVAEITALGGKAVADTHSVATAEGAAEFVQRAVDAFGGVDIVVNNAAVVAIARFEEMSVRDYQRHIEVNLLGAIWVARAAWPFMMKKRYGRIVNIGSDALRGMALHSAYGTTKGGLFSLTRALADEGAAHGIKANTVNPFAYTRMMQSTQRESSAILQLSRSALPAEKVSPVVAYLSHADCPVSGECFATTGGSVKRLFLSETRGFADAELTIESLAAGFAQVMDMTGATMTPAGFTGTNIEDIKAYAEVSGAAGG